jgi:hypothetical protein
VKAALAKRAVPSSNSSGPSSSSNSEVSSSSEEDNRGERSKGSKRKRRNDLDLDLLEELWPKEDRPKRLQKKSVLSAMTMTKLMKMKELYEKEQAKKGLGTAVFGKDKKQRTRRYKAMKDDGLKRLHPARFISMPTADPKDYWYKVPTGKTEVFRHLPLQHVGVENMPEATIVKLHDRRVPVDLDMMRRELKDVHMAKLAMANYVMVMRMLHPIDNGPATLQMVLIEARWGESLADAESKRLQLLKRFFEDCARENSGRAVRREPPMDYTQV